MVQGAYKVAATSLIVTLVSFTAACDSAKETSGAASAKPADKPAASASTQAANAPKEADVGADKMGTFTCKDIKDDACVGPTDHFAADAPVVHVTYKTKDLPKEGDVYSMQWIAEDVGAAAKPNTVIATVEKKVEGLPDIGLKNYVVNTQLTKPNKGWPVGKYRVEIKLADELVTTARFTIE